MNSSDSSDKLLCAVPLLMLYALARSQPFGIITLSLLSIYGMSAMRGRRHQRKPLTMILVMSNFLYRFMSSSAFEAFENGSSVFQYDVRDVDYWVLWN
jgi:hypothetical protein